MKVALAVNLSMLALLGGLAWRVGGSPFLLAASMGVVLVYALLGIRPGKVVEITRFVTSTLLGLGVTPTVFYTFGRKAAATAIENDAPASH